MKLQKYAPVVFELHKFDVFKDYWEDILFLIEYML